MIALTNIAANVFDYKMIRLCVVNVVRGMIALKTRILGLQRDCVVSLWVFEKNKLGVSFN
jgi:hypothetical protein